MFTKFTEKDLCKSLFYKHPATLKEDSGTSVLLWILKLFKSTFFAERLPVTTKNLRLSNVNRVIIGNLNINSLTNKFDQLKEIVLEYIDILVITETKLGNTFSNTQFLVSGFSKPFRLDRNRKGCGVMIYVRKNIPSKLLTKHVLPSDVECIFLELNFRKCKWILVGTYHPHFTYRRL